MARTTIGANANVPPSPAPRFGRSSKRLGLLARAGVLSCAVVAMAACGNTPTKRGNFPDPDRVREIQLGVHTKADIAAILGTPSVTGTFDDKTWYYIGRKTEQVAFFRPDTVDQQVLQVMFDEQGLVADLKAYGLDDARSVSYSSRETPGTGKQFTIMEQLLGNLGRFEKPKQ